MNERLMELEGARAAALVRAKTILARPVLTAEDRRAFRVQMDLAEEIRNFAARLQNPKEKWSVTAAR